MAEIPNFPSNNRIARNEKDEPQVKRVAKPVAKGVIKENKVLSFASKFLAEDPEDIRNGIVWDIIVPSLKEIFMSSLGRALGTDFRGFSSGKKSSYVQYGSIYKSGSQRTEEKGVDTRRLATDIRFKTKPEALEVLTQLDDIADAYNFVRVAELYEAAGIDDIPHTAQKYGWTDVIEAKVVYVGGSEPWELKMPPARPL